MSRIEADIEPPGLADDEDDWEPGPMIGLFMALHEGDGTARRTDVMLSAEASDAEIAGELLRMLPALGRLRGPGLQQELERRIGRSA